MTVFYIKAYVAKFDRAQKSQCQIRVIIKTNYDGKESPILHTKFHGNHTIGTKEDFLRDFTIYVHRYNLGHVPSIMSTNFNFHKSLHIKFDSTLLSCF